MGIGDMSLAEDVLPEDYLELTDGTIVKNLRDLSDSLKKMKKDDFSLHVTKNRNDFAEWILESYNDEKLTQKLLRVRDKNKIIKILDSVLKDAKEISFIESPRSKKQALKSLEKVSYEM
jgi:hypothetical protein